MKKGKKALSLLLAMGLLLPLSGCFPTQAEDLYQLPEISGSYQDLQEAVDKVLDEGAEYSSPAAGAHRQAVQLEDLDGDGVQEAVAFFRMPEGEAPMTVCVFRRSGDGSYTEAARISGEGTGFHKVAYADMDGDGIREILVGRQMSPELKLLTATGLKEYQPAELVSVDYTDFLVSDFTGDSLSDLGVIRMRNGDTGGEAELYSMAEDGEVMISRAPLSANAESLTRLRTTLLVGGGRGFLAECAGTAGLVTDVFAWQAEKLDNLTIREETGISEKTTRSYAVYSNDLNDDGVVEIPHPVAMASQSESTVYYRLDWMAYGAHGRQRQIATTYHNYTDGWYMELVPEWDEFVTVRRADFVSGERSVIFSVTDGAGKVLYDYLIVHTLSGDNREERAAIPGRFLLRSEGSTIYVAELIPGTEGYGAQLTEQAVKDSFHMIYSDWETGEN